MGGLANYAGGVLEIAGELRHSLTAEEIKQLHDRFNGTKLGAWFRWRADNEALVLAFVSSTPSQRSKLKKFAEHRLLLTLAGISVCHEGAAVLRVITCPELRAGGSYRSMAAEAGNSYTRILAEDVPYWPFADLKSPFLDDPANVSDEQEH